jgi:hypothetical protein
MPRLALHRGGDAGMNGEEEALIRAFVVASKQERYLGFIVNPKRRKKFVAALYHFDDFDRSWRVAIHPSPT